MSKRITLIGLCILLLISVFNYNIGNISYGHSQGSGVRINDKLEMLHLDAPEKMFISEAIAKGNKNFLGIEEFHKNIFANTKLNMVEVLKEEGEKVVNVEGMVVVYNGDRAFSLKLKGSINYFKDNDVEYYFGPVYTEFNYKGSMEIANVGIFYNVDEEKLHLSTVIGGIGNENGTSILNFGELAHNIGEIHEKYANQQGVPAVDGLEVVENENENEMNISSVQLQSTEQIYEFRGTASAYDLWIDGTRNTSNYWVALADVYIRDHKSDPSLIDWFMVKDRVYTNNNNVKKYIDNYSSTTGTNAHVTHVWAEHKLEGNFWSTQTMDLYIHAPQNAGASFEKGILGIVPNGNYIELGVNILVGMYNLTLDSSSILKNGTIAKGARWDIKNFNTDQRSAIDWNKLGWPPVDAETEEGLSFYTRYSGDRGYTPTGQLKATYFVEWLAQNDWFYGYVYTNWEDFRTTVDVTI